MDPAQTACRTIAAGAFVTGVVMVVFSQDIEATTDSGLVGSIVHISNVKFMAAMWCVMGVVFAIGSTELHEEPAWRLLRVACVGVSAAAVVRLVEMVRLEQFSLYGAIAAAIELVFPAVLIYLRRRQYPRAAT